MTCAGSAMCRRKSAEACADLSLVVLLFMVPLTSICRGRERLRFVGCSGESYIFAFVGFRLPASTSDVSCLDSSRIPFWGP